jgi:hypothetical protein
MRVESTVHLGQLVIDSDICVRQDFDTRLDAACAQLLTCEFDEIFEMIGGRMEFIQTCLQTNNNGQRTFVSVSRA